MLDRSSGYIMSNPEKTSLIVTSCIVLHNIAIKMNQELDINDDALLNIIRQDRLNGNYLARQRGNAFVAGMNRRNEFVTNYFNR